MGKHAQRGEEQRQEQAYYEGQQSAMAAAPPPQAPPAPSGPTSDDIQRLTELGKLHEQGILTDEEFAQQKASILGR